MGLNAICMAPIHLMDEYRGMISAAQIRAARALLGWPQRTLADKALVAVNTVRQAEGGQTDSRSSTITRIRATLEAAGIEFVSEDSRRGEGVRFQAPKEAKNVGGS